MKPHPKCPICYLFSWNCDLVFAEISLPFKTYRQFTIYFFYLFLKEWFLISVLTFLIYLWGPYCIISIRVSMIFDRANQFKWFLEHFLALVLVTSEFQNLHRVKSYILKWFSDLFPVDFGGFGAVSEIPARCLQILSLQATKETAKKREVCPQIATVFLGKLIGTLSEGFFHIFTPTIFDFSTRQNSKAVHNTDSKIKIIRVQTRSPETSLSRFGRDWEQN